MFVSKLLTIEVVIGHGSPPEIRARLPDVEGGEEFWVCTLAGTSSLMARNLVGLAELICHQQKQDVDSAIEELEHHCRGEPDPGCIGKPPGRHLDERV